MQYQVFIIPVVHHKESIEKLNRFLREHKIVQVGEQMIVDGMNSFWAFCDILSTKIIPKRSRWLTN